MKPARDINMATQSEIGAFNDEKQVSFESRNALLPVIRNRDNCPEDLSDMTSISTAQ